ncbi:hypothetical protein AAOGI_22690 [Agarivorans albus]
MKNNDAALIKSILEQIAKIQDSIFDIKRRTQVADLINKPILDINECGVLLSMTSAQIYKLTSNQKIPHSKIGKHLRFDRDEIIVWVKENRIATQREIEQRASNHMNKNVKIPR